MGLLTPVALGGYKCVSKVTDECTKWTAVYLLTNKNQALQSRQLFIDSTAISSGGRIVRWRTDKGSEYTWEEFRQYCLESDIIHEFAATNTPQQLGVSERVEGTLCAMAQFMLADSGFPSSMRGELSIVAEYLKNRTPQKALKMATPIRMFYGEEAHLSPLRVIGIRTFVHMKDSRKLDAAAWEGKLCGYGEKSKSYQVWNPKIYRVVESRNIIFVEKFPHLLPVPSKFSPLQELIPLSWYLDDNTLDNGYIPYDDLLRDVRDYTNRRSELHCHWRVDRSENSGICRSNPRSQRERLAHARCTFIWSNIISGTFALSCRGTFVRGSITAE